MAQVIDLFDEASVIRAALCLAEDHQSADARAHEHSMSTREGPEMNRHVTQAVEHAHHAALLLMRKAYELAERRREHRVRLSEERDALREVSRSGSFRQ